MVVIFIVNLILNFPFGIVYSLSEELTSRPSGFTLHDTTTDTNTTGKPGNESLETATVLISFQRICSAGRSNFFNYLNWYHIWFMDWFLIFIIPFSLITVSNLAALYLVVSRKKTFQSKLDSKIKGITMRAVMHCVTTGPFSISILFPGYFSRALSVKYSDEYYINRVCFILAFLNHAINFLLYSFFGSEFRRDFLEIWKRHAAVHPVGTSALRPSGNTGDDKSFTGDSRARNEDMLKTGKTNISTVSSGTKC